MSERPRPVLVDAAGRSRAAGETAADRRGRMLVEAAAGTGKTTVLLSRVLATVRSGDRRLSEIAVVTFTEAAAAELKIRLRRAIREALEQGEEAEVAARLTEALADLEVAAVGTIHAFALDLLKQRPIEAGVDPGFQVADDFDQRLRRARAWDLFLRRLDDSEPGLEAAYDLGLAREDELRRLAFELADVDRDRLPRPDDHLAERWPVLWRRIGEELESAHASADEGGALRRGVGGALAAWRELSEASPREAQRAVLDGDFKIPGRGGKASEVEAKAARDAARALLTEAEAELAHQRLAELAGWLSGLGAVDRRLAERDGRLSFDQLIERTLELLTDHPAVLEDFRRRYPVILVDEFQDTDPTQIDLLLLLAGPVEVESDAGGARSLFLVGDPKQSIYRFRGADLKSYRRVAEKEIPARGRVFLEQTFRPLPALAEWVNEVMAKVMAEVTESYEADYRPLAARVPEATPESGGVLYLEFDPPEDGGVDESREAEAEAFARAIRHLVEDGAGTVRGADGALRPARYGDVALLLPKMTILGRYERVLHRARIPFRVVGGRHYYRRDEVHALLGLLRALADPGDPVAVVAALRGPAFGLSDSDLLAYSLCRPQPRIDAAGPAARTASSPEPARAERVAAALADLASLAEETRGYPLPELVTSVLERTGLIPFFALADRGEQRVANLRKVVRVARRVESGGADSLSAFIRWLETLLEDEPEESDSPYLEGAGASVQIMTVHKAKGLEFPIVFLGGLPSGASRGRGRLSIWDDGRGGLALALSSKRGTRGHEEAEARAKAEEHAEVKRLLYVAVTRSRDQLVLPLPTVGETKEWGPLFRSLYAEGEGHPDKIESDHRRVASSSLPALPTAAPSSRIRARALVGGAKDEALARRADALRRPRPESSPVRPSGVEVAEESPEGGVSSDRRAALTLGTLAHELLALALSGTSRGGDGASGDLLSPEAAEELAASFGASAAVAEEASTLANVFLRSELGDRALGAEERLVEVPISVAGAGGRILDGQIDLAWLEEGGWVLLDHKTDRVKKGAEGERGESYREQLGLYAEALARASGRPILAVHLFFLTSGKAVSWLGAELAAMLEAARAELDGPG